MIGVELTGTKKKDFMKPNPKIQVGGFVICDFVVHSTLIVKTFLF